MAPEPSAPANGTSEMPAWHGPQCLRRKTLRRLLRWQREADVKMQEQVEANVRVEGKVDHLIITTEGLVRGQEAILGGASHINDSMAVTQQEHARRLTHLEGQRAAWRNWAAGIVGTLLGGLLVWFITGPAADWLKSRQGSPPVVSSPSPTVLATTPRPPDLAVPHVAEAP